MKKLLTLCKYNTNYGLVCQKRFIRCQKLKFLCVGILNCINYVKMNF